MTQSSLWLAVPNLLACVAVLVTLRRQTRSHRKTIAQLDALKRSLEALGAAAGVDPPPRRPRHDPVDEVLPHPPPRVGRRRR